MTLRVSCLLLGALLCSAGRVAAAERAKVLETKDPRAHFIWQPREADDRHVRFQLGVLYDANAFGERPQWIGTSLVTATHAGASTHISMFATDGTAPRFPVFLIPSGDGALAYDERRSFAPGEANPFGLKRQVHIVEARTDGNTVGDPAQPQQLELSDLRVLDGTKFFPFDAEDAVRDARTQFDRAAATARPAIEAIFASETAALRSGARTNSPLVSTPMAHTFPAPESTILWAPDLRDAESDHPQLAVTFLLRETRFIVQVIDHDDGCERWRAQGQACDPVAFYSPVMRVVVETAATFVIDGLGHAVQVEQVPPAQRLTLD